MDRDRYRAGPDRHRPRGPVAARRRPRLLLAGQRRPVAALAAPRPGRRRGRPACPRGRRRTRWSTSRRTGTSAPVDVVFPVLHGPYGRGRHRCRGCSSSAGIPYVGAGVLGSAVGMDKDVMKRLLRDAGIPIGAVPRRPAREHERAPTFAEAAARARLPAASSSRRTSARSVGVSKARDRGRARGGARASPSGTTRKVARRGGRRGRARSSARCSATTSPSPRCRARSSSHADEFYDYEAKYLDEHGAALRDPGATRRRRRPREVQRPGGAGLPRARAAPAWRGSTSS